jgi:hypothetical protein
MHTVSLSFCVPVVCPTQTSTDESVFVPFVQEPHLDDSELLKACARSHHHRLNFAAPTDAAHPACRCTPHASVTALMTSPVSITLSVPVLSQRTCIPSPGKHVPMQVFGRVPEDRPDVVLMNELPTKFTFSHSLKAVAARTD